MATTSITHNIIIKDEQGCIKLLNALEEAKNVISKKFYNFNWQ